MSQTEHFILNEKDYILENGIWYTNFQGVSGDQIIPQRIIVRLHNKDYMEIFDFGKLSLDGVTLASKRYLDGFYILSISPEKDAFSVASLLEKSKLFDVIEFDSYGVRTVIPGDPQYSNQWNHPKVEMPNAWNITTGKSSTILGIIDSGVNYTHEDLDANIYVFPDEDKNNNGVPDFYPFAQGGDLDGADNDGNGYADDLIGWDFAGGGNNPQEPYQADNDPSDTDGHGTSVAGIPSAQTNNYEGSSYIGIAGIAGGWDNSNGTSLMVLRDGGVSPIHSLTATAIEYAAKNGAKTLQRVLNCLQRHRESLQRVPKPAVGSRYTIQRVFTLPLDILL